ncbi:uncharacterized protein LOC117806592 [Notolabrus celidotus]|uniref:uncharacterized protein LOC117806592 n=1 Tax=Notolabrus celidotus TaxID=1203425 RepID=UPI00149043E4|nr:uncharacterized protein LOC117806592 [Notolabrus celidotus]
MTEHSGGSPHIYQLSYVMDHSFRGPAVLKRNLRVLNQKEERDLQQRLNMLDKQYRYTFKMLQQRRDSLMNEHRRAVMVKVCEPKATVNIAMKDIWELKNTETFFRGPQTSEDRRTYSDKEEHQVEMSCSISAPLPSIKAASSVRHRGNIQSSMSFRQMKNIAAIDSISEKELARRRQEAREEMEKLRRFEMETLHQRVSAFIDKIKDKSNMQVQVEPP